MDGAEVSEATVWSECLAATNEIWDDREAYIEAILDRLGIDPTQPWSEYSYTQEGSK